MWNGTEDKIKSKNHMDQTWHDTANGEHRYLGKTDEPLSETGNPSFAGKKEGIFFQPTGIFVYISDETLRSDSGTAF